MNLKNLKSGLALTALVFAGSASQAQNNKFIDRANMDFSVKPGDDFYQYASGPWVKNNPVPAKETTWGSFNVLREFNIQAVKGLLETAAADKNAKAGSVTKRVGDFYTAGMDSVAIEKLGFSPIKADLARIKTIKNTQGVLDEIAYQRVNAIGSPLFGFGVGQDRKIASKYAVYVSQGGTSLGDRDFYLKDDPQSVRIRTAYKKYLNEIFTLLGNSEADAKLKADNVFALEKQLAEAQLSRIEMKDQQKTYNKFTVNDFAKLSDKIDWKAQLGKLNVKTDTVITNNPAFFKTVNNLLVNTPVAQWQDYLTWSVAKNAAPWLSSAFVNANFAFAQANTGQKVQTPRWQRMSSLTDGAIGDLLGQLYVAKYFKPEAKKRMDEMIANLRKAFEIRIKNLDWMSDATKQKALVKLHAFTPKIGYPSKWKNYDGLEIKSNTFLQNLRNVGVWDYKENIGKLGQPIDRDRFGMTPPTVNAYYSPSLNEIVFPAGILQFPFFAPDADDAVNYGGIGAVIGHEMSHGFDDTGAQYDDKGNLRNWWTDEDLAKFKAKTGKLVEQFNSYTVLDTMHVLGKLTLGENIGDLGGLNAAYTAFKMTKQGQSNDKIDGFTPDQRFFLSWAQVWRGNILPERAAQLIKTDPHSPGPYRTIGAPVNMDEWYKAFDVKEGDNLYKKPEDRIKIW